MAIKNLVQFKELLLLEYAVVWICILMEKLTHPVLLNKKQLIGMILLLISSEKSIYKIIVYIQIAHQPAH